MDTARPLLVTSVRTIGTSTGIGGLSIRKPQGRRAIPNSTGTQVARKSEWSVKRAVLTKPAKILSQELTRLPVQLSRVDFGKRFSYVVVMKIAGE